MPRPSSYLKKWWPQATTKNTTQGPDDKPQQGDDKAYTQNVTCAPSKLRSYQQEDNTRARWQHLNRTMTRHATSMLDMLHQSSYWKGGGSRPPPRRQHKAQMTKTRKHKAYSENFTHVRRNKSSMYEDVERKALFWEGWIKYWNIALEPQSQLIVNIHRRSKGKLMPGEVLLKCWNIALDPQSQ